MPSSRYAVAIVGGGLVGLSLAALLGKQGIDTVLLEASEPVRDDWPEDSIDLRVYAITRASRRLFEQVGAWPAMQSRACAYTDMRVWDAGGDGRIHFDCAEIGEPELGHIIESRVIEAALLEVLGEQPSVTRLCPAVVESFTAVGDGQMVCLEGGDELVANLLVGADGRQSRVRELAGLHAVVSGYGQQAIVCVVGTELPHGSTARQRFLPTGPLAFLPLFDGRCSIVWSATNEYARRLMQLDDTAFREALGEAFDHCLGAVTSVGERALFPLHRQHASQYVAERVALVGDAAHVIHPLAGQGVNLGLKDVSELGRCIAEAVQRGDDPGYFSLLRRYERARKGDNVATMAAMDGFKHLFGSSLPPLRWLRNTGLNLVDAAWPLKNRIMRQAMGL